MIEVHVVQGIGDIFWVYQKLSPHFDAIDIVVLVVGEDGVQYRAQGFLPLLPKVRKVSYKLVDSATYNRVAATRYPLAPLLANPDIAHEYAVNNVLEHGIRLDADDPVEWNVRFKVDDARVIPHPYLLLYVSGSSRHWHDKFSPGQWGQLYHRLLQQNGLLDMPTILIGAGYDEWMLQEVAVELRRVGYSNFTLNVDHPPETAIRLLRDAALLVGFQSGLNVIANNYGTPVIMVDFNHLKTMAHSWCRPGDVEANRFKEFVFADGIDAIVANSSGIMNTVRKELGR